MASRRFPFVKFLSSNGDGTGTTEWSADYSETAGLAKISPGAGKLLHVSTLLLHISDNGPFTRVGFGSDVGPLASGIQIYFQDKDGNITNYGPAMTSNDSMFHVASDFRLITWSGPEDSSVFKFTAETFGVSDMEIRHGESLVVKFQDNLSGQTHVHVIAHGHEELEV